MRSSLLAASYWLHCYTTFHGIPTSVFFLSWPSLFFTSLPDKAVCIVHGAHRHFRMKVSLSCRPKKIWRDQTIKERKYLGSMYLAVMMYLG